MLQMCCWHVTLSQSWRLSWTMSCHDLCEAVACIVLGPHLWHLLQKWRRSVTSIIQFRSCHQEIFEADLWQVKFRELLNPLEFRWERLDLIVRVPHQLLEVRYSRFCTPELYWTTLRVLRGFSRLSNSALRSRALELGSILCDEMMLRKNSQHLIIQNSLQNVHPLPWRALGMHQQYCLNIEQ